MPLSRRQFLRTLGISAATSTIAGFSFPANSEGVGLQIVQGRALHTASIRTFPAFDAPVTRQMWDGEIFAIRSIQADWFRTREGYVAFHDAQPMWIASSVASQHPPFWAEVSGATAPIREWCAGDAPVVTQIGHGGVMRIVDLLTMQQTAWYGIADEDDRLIGWSRSLLWSAASWRQEPRLDLVINRATQHATLLDGSIEQVQASVSFGKPLLSGSYPIVGTFPSQTYVIAGIPRYGIPYVQYAGENNPLTLGGVYWHNRFGAQLDGMDIQLPALLARKIFGRLRRVILY
jgi:hypothetical protein